MFSFTGAGDFGKGWNFNDAEKDSAKTNEVIKVKKTNEEIINKFLRKKENK
jgi:hypothetical protein